MSYSMVKLWMVFILTLVILALMTFFDLDTEVGVPLLTALVGYVVGNAQVTGNTPIVSRNR